MLHVTLMREGLYSIKYLTQLGAGAGVVHLAGGKIWGGDSGIYVVGTYTVDGEKMVAQITTNRHTQIGGRQSVFGMDQITITLKGIVQGDAIKLTGSAPDAPHVIFEAELKRLCD